MLDKLAAIEEKYEQINRQLFDPEVVKDMARYKKLMQEEKRLAPIVEKFREYKKAKSDLDEAKELLEAGCEDKELKEMLADEIEQSSLAAQRAQEELKILLLPRDEND
ncbi:MAG: PCRF domain-containing protein, partial [Acutalibacteraceae bacterium]